MKAFFLSSIAEQDIDDIVSYIVQENYIPIVFEPYIGNFNVYKFQTSAGDF